MQAGKLVDRARQVFHSNVNKLLAALVAADDGLLLGLVQLQKQLDQVAVEVVERLGRALLASEVAPARVVKTADTFNDANEVVLHALHKVELGLQRRGWLSMG